MVSEIVKKGALLTDDEKDKEYRERKKSKIEKSINKGDDIPPGWEIKKEFKTKVRLFKEKDVDVELEDKVWCLFYDLGVKRISSRDFTILLRKRGNVEKTKEIDVVAIDDDVAFIVECKSRQELGKKSLKKEIAHFADYEWYQKIDNESA